MCVFIYITFITYERHFSGDAEEQQHGMHAEKSGFKLCAIFFEIIL